jgi:predicted lipid-binding transport protein (Tim44 family)
MRKQAVLVAVLLVLAASVPVWARGGGGCLARGTPIPTPAGATAIENLRVGDPVWSVVGGELQAGSVMALTETRADRYLEILTGDSRMVITPEHPVMAGPGEYRIARLLKVGDRVYRMRHGNLDAVPIRSIQPVRADQPAYNLMVMPGGTFIPAGIVVHNKGCFLPESLILQSDGAEKPISAVRPGDPVLAYSPEGRIVQTRVRNILRHTVDEYVILTTERQTIRATAEHPFYVGRGTFKTLDILKAGDTVFAREGKSLSEQHIVSIRRVRERVSVFNLQTDHPNTFFAGGIAVHNKGGGGGGGFSRSSSSRSSSSRSGSGGSGDNGVAFVVFFLFIIILIILVVAVAKRKTSKSENLDYLYPPAAVAKKAVKTEKLLSFLSKQDPSLSATELRKLAESTFRKLQECWRKRGYGPMEPLLMQALFRQHTAQLQGMARNHEINRIDDLRVEKVDIVNVRYTEKNDQREFSALITASAVDYYVDDRNQKYLRGDESSSRFQEFWTFQRSGDRWLLREIEQSGESDLLKEENFVEMLTDQTVQGVYGGAAGKEGKAGPWLEKGAEEKATRIDRMLNFLVRTDKLWNRQQMIERARQVFLSVFLARESGDPEQAPEADLFRDVGESLRKQVLQWRMEGTNVEYRNLCVRKAELILVRNFTNPAKDEFTVRISAHAQKIVRKGNHILSEQQYVTPFEEYWTFGRLDEVWKLKEVLPPAQGERLITEENVDEESGAGQMQWYYRQPRAN